MAATASSAWRFVAMLTAIVVSVAFLAASRVLLATESNALAQRTVLYASKADVVVTSHLWHWGGGRSQRDRAVADAEAALRADPRDTASDTPGASSGGVGQLLLVRTVDPAEAEPVRAATAEVLDSPGRVVRWRSSPQRREPTAEAVLQPGL